MSSQRIPGPLLSQLSQFVAAQIGLHFPPERWHDLERGISSVAQELNFANAESCISWLVSSPLTKDQIETLASHLTIGETYFFREKRTFEILAEHIFPQFIRSRSGSKPCLKIWSAGCCTGEEPYSIAMLLDRLIPDIHNWRITILATDINPHFLRQASTGVYSEWSFRDSPQWIKEKYFARKEDGRLAILPHLKRMVHFAYLNLVEDVYPSLLNHTQAIDVIFCRNVLMYFAPEQMKKVVDNLYRSLVDGGWLMVSPSETSQTIYAQFITVNFPGLILYRKVLSSDSRAADRGDQLAGSDPRLATLNLPPPMAEAQATGTLPQKPSQPVGLKEMAPAKTADPRPSPYAEAHENHSPATALLARAYANQGKLAEALAWCEKAVAADKLNPGLHYLRATILQEQGAVAEAVMSLKRVLYLDQNFVLAHFALGNLMLRQGKLSESQKHLENALALLPAYRPEETLPEAEGVTAGRLGEIIVSLMEKKTLP
jgi:chemotaxis protein methyltransferase CheR